MASCRREIRKISKKVRSTKSKIFWASIYNSINVHWTLPQWLCEIPILLINHSKILNTGMDKIKSKSTAWGFYSIWKIISCRNNDRKARKIREERLFAFDQTRSSDNLILNLIQFKKCNGNWICTWLWIQISIQNKRNCSINAHNQQCNQKFDHIYFIFDLKADSNWYFQVFFSISIRLIK